MKDPLFIRPLTPEERQALGAGLESADAFTQRRCRILLANAEGRTATKIAVALGCSQQTVLNALNAFAREGLECLIDKTRHPKVRRLLISGHCAENIRALLHRDPREFGRSSHQWTYAAVAEVAFELGLSDRTVSQETIKRFVRRLGVDWRCARSLGALTDLPRQTRVACQSGLIPPPGLNVNIA